MGAPETREQGLIAFYEFALACIAETDFESIGEMRKMAEDVLRTAMGTPATSTAAYAVLTREGMRQLVDEVERDRMMRRVRKAVAR